MTLGDLEDRLAAHEGDLFAVEEEGQVVVLTHRSARFAHGARSTAPARHVLLDRSGKIPNETLRDQGRRLSEAARGRLLHRGVQVCDFVEP